MLDEHPQSDNLNIRILEKENSLGSKSTAAAGCGMRTLYRHDTNLELARRGLRFWSNAEPILGQEIGFRRNGYLFLTNNQQTRETLNKQSQKQHINGFNSEINPGKTKTKGIDNLGLSNYSFSLYLPNSGLASPNKIVSALQNKINKSDISVCTDTQVLDLKRGGDQWDVLCEDGKLRSDYVVNAAGAWAGQVAKMVDTNLPIKNTRRRLSKMDRSVDPDTPLTVDIDTGAYILPDEDGTLLAGGNLLDGMDRYDENDPSSFSLSIDEDWNKKFRSAASNIDNSLSNATIVDSWTGLYAMTESRVPIISENKGIIHACGFSGHGIMQAPGAGHIVSRIICEGYNPMLRGLGINNRPDSTDIQF
ncbi:MAG: hypothetical protein BRC29_00545 [Nanohaloarchaea archaeon SW_7_43_1]|nr:MAG: hypothetical protein BRC29_00545 [Nanohaloarchaea archaeon SW_7_43_1]